MNPNACRHFPAIVCLSMLYSAACAFADGKPFGIEHRVAWTTSKVKGSPEPPPPYRSEPAFPQLSFSRPIALTRLPGTDRLVVVELNGGVLSFHDRANAKPEVMIQLAKELPKCSRVYGIAFHPRFQKNREVFICYITDGDSEFGTRVSRFRVTNTDPPRIDASTEEVILRWRSGGHNGGCMKFGPDGYLYITTGDASSPAPPDSRNTGQDISDLLSSVLRIDVDTTEGDRKYGIPNDNPFVALKGARPEVWAYGFRNPWKISFDPKGGSLWLGDVGWEMFEMIYRIERGGNYGWSVKEGPQTVRAEVQHGPTPIQPATVAHSHIESRSITGGVVYRGSRLKKLEGHYIYGDYVTGKLWAFPVDGAVGTKPLELMDAPYQVVAFGTDTNDEFLVVTYDGTLQRLSENTGAAVNQDFPTQLSTTGLFQSVPDHRLANGVIPYSLVAEPWADGAIARRAIAVPGTGKLAIQTENNVQQGKVRGAFAFPSDTVILKTLSLPATKTSPERRIETQILHMDGDTWRAYSYRWNKSQTDAELVPADGLDIELNATDESRKQSLKRERKTDSQLTDAKPGDAQQDDSQRISTWHFASRVNCIVCHTTRAGSIHGFKPSQLNGPHDYGTVTDNQLRTLEHVGLFDDPNPQLKKLGVKASAIVDPYARAGDLESRARAYLHVNCAHCHLRGGGGTAVFQLLHHLSLEQTGAVASRPTQGAFGIYRAEVIAPKDPYRSVLLYRMSKLGKGRMPHIGSSMVDVDGVRLIHDWIAQLAPLAKKPNEAPQKPDDAIHRLRESQRKKVEQVLVNGTANPQAIGELLETTSGGLLLLNAVDRTAAPAIQNQIAMIAARHPNDAVRGLFERFVPHSQRQRRLGTTIDAAVLLAKPGSIRSGRALFATAAGMQCRNCHKAEKIGKDLGPGLDQIGKRLSRPQLLESILEPSKKIDEKYRSYVVETVKGRVFTGIMAKSTDMEVVLVDSAGKEIRLKRTDIETLAPQLKSLMPDLLVRDMTAQQVADLLAYLASLK